jgi:hypothetical protein
MLIEKSKPVFFLNSSSLPNLARGRVSHPLVRTIFPRQAAHEKPAAASVMMDQ